MLSLIHISEPTRHDQISYAVFSVLELQPPAFALDIENKVSAPKIKAHEVLIDFMSLFLLWKNNFVIAKIIFSSAKSIPF